MKLSTSQESVLESLKGSGGVWASNNPSWVRGNAPRTERTMKSLVRHGLVSVSVCSHGHHIYRVIMLPKPQPSADDIKKAFLDLMDAHDEHDIQRNTGLPLERCKAIYDIYCAIDS